jgi:hypothetical protein
MMNSENLGVKIAENGALDRKIWTLEAFGGEAIFLGDSRGICGILSGWKVLARKNRGSCGVWAFFWGFLECLGQFRT